METLWVGLSSPSISALLRYRVRENPALWGAYSSCLLQEVAEVSCRGAARRQAPFSHPPLVGPQQQALPPQRSREIPQHPGCSQRATPHTPTLLGANSSLRGAEKEMTYYCLLFHSANREAFIADGTQGNVAQNGEKENAAGKITGAKRQSASASQKTCA